jgi:hypothetical protein
MNRLVILTIVVGLFGCDRKEEATPEVERGPVKPAAKVPAPTQDQITLADYIKDKRVYIDLDVGPEAENPFVQFNPDGTYQAGSMVGGVATTPGKPGDQGTYEVSGLIITLTGDDGGGDELEFSTVEPVGGDKFTITKEEEETVLTILKVEEASPITTVAAEEPGKEKELDVPVVEALIRGDLKALEEYIEDGIDLNQRDKDRNTPLMLSIIFGRADAAKALIEGGAKLDLKNKDGNTALMSAAFLGQTETVKILLAEGADLEIRSNVGSTALDLAELPWEAAKGIVDLISALVCTPLGIKLDYDEIEAGRPVCAQLLREAGR